MSDALKGREIIVEFQPSGSLVRVSAMDVKTLTEVVIQGPASAGKNILQKNVLSKMEFILRKKGIIA